MARVDVIAQGVVDAHKEMKMDVPVVVRLAGTNVAEGERILEDAGLPLDPRHRPGRGRPESGSGGGVGG